MSEKQLETIEHILAEFKGEIGEIYPILNEVIRSTKLCVAPKGSVHGEDYFKEGKQWIYLITGGYESLSMNPDGSEISGTLSVKSGDLVHTPARVAHQLCFKEDSIYLWMTDIADSEIKGQKESHSFPEEISHG